MKAQFLCINKVIAHHEKLAFITQTLEGRSPRFSRHSRSHNQPQ